MWYLYNIHTVLGLEIKFPSNGVRSTLNYFLTIRVTTFTAERTFSVLRRLKINYYDSGEILYHIYTHKDLTDQTDLKNIAKVFTGFIMIAERVFVVNSNF